MSVPGTSSPYVKGLLTAGFIAALWAGVIGLLWAVEQQRPPSVRAAELAYLPKGEYLKVAVLGYRQMAADLIWLQAVQHLGARKGSEEGYRWAYHAVDVVTDLDPQFWFAYLAAGTILGLHAGMPERSVAILTKGMRHNPTVWQLPFFAGYDYFFELHDPTMAAKYFRIAAELPGSPAYLPKLAARMTVQAGDPDAALEFLERLYHQMADERLREGLAYRMKEVTVERDIKILEEAVRRYQARAGKLPNRLEDLVASGLLMNIPQEPLGGSYSLDASSGAVTSSGLYERLRVHQK